MVKIYLDAGHGGGDPGAVGNGIMEKNITLSLAKKIEAKLKANYKNVEIMTTRTTDIFLTLDQRTDKANSWGADVFLSVHVNSSTSVSGKGFESHIYTNVDARTKAYQNVMHSEIMKAITGVEDRGKKQSNFHVLRESHMAAILTENLFISNSSDASLLKQDAFLEKLANGHVIGLEKFLGLEKATPTAPKPTADGLFQVIAGTFSSRENAEKQVTKLKADGYESYIIEKQ